MRMSIALLAITALLLGSAPAANAETRSFGDRSERRVAAMYDIEQTRIANGKESLRVTIKIEKPRHGTRIFFRTQMVGEPGWLLDAYAWRTTQGKVQRLYLWPNTQNRNRIDCPSMRSAWMSDGRVKLQIPHSCIYGPRSWREFRTGTYSGGGEVTHLADDSRRDSLVLDAG